MTTEQPVGAGDTTRPVLKVGDEIQAAVVVPEALEGEETQIILSPDDGVREIVNLIQRG